MRIKAGDESKKAITTKYGSYEFNVMPVKLTNASVTSYMLLQEVLKEFLNKFIMVYLDNIIIYSNSMEEHVGYLRQVFTALRANILCEFGLCEISFMGHIVGDRKIHMELQKIKEIMDCEAPRSPFLRLVNYYR